MLRRTLLATAAATAMIAGVAHADGHEPLKVGFVYVGPIGDGGWTYEHDKGRLAVVKQNLAMPSKQSSLKACQKAPTQNA